MKFNCKGAVTALAATAVLALTLTGCGNVSDADSASDSDSGSTDGEFTIVTVSKVEGIPWFERMATGVAKFGEDNASEVTTRQTGPSSGDAAQQIQIVQDLIAQDVDALVVVPNDPQSIAPVLKQARDKGIVVITHEAPALAGTDSVDYDVEAFDNKVFGEKQAEALSKAAGGTGDYVGMVASLTNETHMAWYNAAKDYLVANYPDMKAVTDAPYEDNNDDATAQSKSLEILNAYPNLKGFLGESVSAGSNFAATLQDKNLKGISVSTLSLPSIAGPYLEGGWMSYAHAWDPAGASYAANALALEVLKGNKPSGTADLGADGYKTATVTDGLVTGDAILVIEPDSFSSGEYPY